MSNRVRGRSRPRMLLLCAALGTLSVLLGACGSSNAASTSSSGSGSASINLAPFEKALQADYKGHFTAPPTSAPPHKSGINLWVISCGQASEGCSQPVANAKEAAQVLGWKATVFDGNFGIGDAYNNGIRQAIAAHAQAIITIGVNCNQAKSGYQAAKAAGIVVVGADSYDCTDPKVNDGSNLFSATVKFTPQIPSAGANEYEDGVAKADWIIVHTKGQAQVIDTNFAGLTGGEYLNEGFVHEMAKCKTCKIVKDHLVQPAGHLGRYPQAGVRLGPGPVPAGQRGGQHLRRDHHPGRLRPGHPVRGPDQDPGPGRHRGLRAEHRTDPGPERRGRGHALRLELAGLGRGGHRPAAPGPQAGRVRGHGRPGDRPDARTARGRPELLGPRQLPGALQEGLGRVLTP